MKRGLEEFELLRQAARKRWKTERIGEAPRRGALGGEPQDEKMTQLEVRDRHLFAVAAAGQPLLQGVAADDHMVAAERVLQRRRAREGAGEAEHGIRAAASRVPDQPGDIPDLGPDARRGWEIALERELLAISRHPFEEWAQHPAILLGVRQCQRRMTRVPALCRLALDALGRASCQRFAKRL